MNGNAEFAQLGTLMFARMSLLVIEEGGDQ